MELDERQVVVSQMDDEELQAALDEHGVGLTVGEARRIAEHATEETLTHVLRLAFSE